METITLKPVTHRGAECLGIYFNTNAKINNALRKIAGIRWSKTLGCWRLPVSRGNYYKLKEELGGLAIIIDKPLLQHYKKEVTATVPLPVLSSRTPLKANDATSL